MKNRKGPYGQFAVETLPCSDKIYGYAMEMIENGQEDTFLPCFTEEKRNGTEISFDHTELLSALEFPEKIDLKPADVTRLRTAAGALFCFFIRCLDLLLPLDNIVLDPSFVFIDPKDFRFRLCYIPLISDNSLDLNSAGEDRILKFLDTKLIRTALSEDEISAVTYAMKTNDERMIMDIFGKEQTDSSKPEAADKKECSSLIIILLLSSASVILSYLFLNRIFLIISAAMTGWVLIRTIRDNIKGITGRSDKGERADQDHGIDRKRILFEKEKEDDDEDELFSYASLQPPAEGEGRSYGLYSSDTKIGSDMFLSDIVIDHDDISPLQAQIIREGRSYFIADVSRDNTTYVDNRRLVPGERYEIKSGQLLRFGDSEYVFKAGY